MVISLLVLPLCSHADFGDFAGESDYGNSDDSWDSDNSYDSNYSWDDDDDRSSSRRKSYQKEPDDGILTEDEKLEGTVSIILCILIFFSIILGVIGSVIISMIRKKNPNFLKKSPKNIVINTGSEPLRSMTEYDAIDPSFSSADLQKKIADLYIRFQHSWQAKDISDLRPFLTDAYYSQMNRQLDNYRNNHQTNCIEDIEVISVQMKGWRKDGHNVEMVAKVETKIVDYVIDDNTGEMIRGSKDQYKLMKYEWTLRSDPAIRASRQSTGTVKKACPDCGAELVINHSGTCPYCGALVTTDSFDWAVCNIKGLAQRTKDK